MNQSKLTRLAGIILVFLLASIVVIAGAALAQGSVPGTEPGGEYVESPGIYGEPDGAVPLQSAPQEGQSQTEGGESNPNQQEMPYGLAPDDNPTTLAPVAPEATFSYYIVSGATLRSRSSNTTGYAYDGTGCTHTTFGTGIDRILNTELTLPDNAVIKYLRVIYKDFSAVGSVSGYVTRYEPGKAAQDLINVGSTNAFASGYGFSVSPEITHTVDNTTYAYTLIGWPSANSSELQICGLRVAYYAPVSNVLVETEINTSNHQQYVALAPENNLATFSYYEVSGATLRNRFSSSANVFLPSVRK